MKSRIDFKRKGNSYLISFDPKCLTTESIRLGCVSVNKFPLWRMLPDPLVQNPVSWPAVRNWQITFFCGLAAIIIFVSDYHVKIPLLAPVLAFFSIVRIFVGIRVSDGRHVSKFITDYGETVLEIPHDQHNEEQRLAFEGQLTESIRAANGAECDND